MEKMVKAFHGSCQILVEYMEDGIPHIYIILDEMQGACTR